LVHGSVRLDAFAPQRLADPDVRALMQRIECVADAELSRAFPGQRAARVEIELADGRRLTHYQPTRKGDPEMPLTDAELNEKFLELTMPVLGDTRARALLARLWALESEKNLDFEPGERVPARVAS
jgi:2-methylcitrate dehydratase PrpD